MGQRTEQLGHRVVGESRPLQRLAEPGGEVGAGRGGHEATLGGGPQDETGPRSVLRGPVVVPGYCGGWNRWVGAGSAGGGGEDGGGEVGT